MLIQVITNSIVLQQQQESEREVQTFLFYFAVLFYLNDNARGNAYSWHIISYWIGYIICFTASEMGELWTSPSANVMRRFRHFEYKCLGPLKCCWSYKCLATVLVHRLLPCCALDREGLWWGSYKESFVWSYSLAMNRSRRQLLITCLMNWAGKIVNEQTAVARVEFSW